MTWRERCVVRILLLVARMICDDDDLNAELRALANHIEVRSTKADTQVDRSTFVPVSSGVAGTEQR